MKQLDPTVFVVDDDKAVREAVHLSLRAAGFLAESYASAHAFLQHFDSERPGCLVLDICMPDMNGLELQQTLSQKDINIPIIFLSGQADVTTSVRALRAGALHFFEKPFDTKALLESIQEAVRLDAESRERELHKKIALRRLAELTPREQEIFELLIDGLPNKDIAIQLNISPRTIEVHRSRVMHKTRSRSTTDLLAMAMVSGVYNNRRARIETANSDHPASSKQMFSRPMHGLEP